MDRGEARRSFGVPERAKMVGYCGFISPVKGLETAVEAVAALPGVGLLVGGGWHTEAETVYMQGFREKALGLLKGRVSFTGYVPDERLAAFYGAVDVCVYPSRFVSESGALLMALSYGKAVIARRLPPTFEKQVAGALLTFRDATDLSRKIKRLLRDEGLRRRVEEGAKAWVEKNSWSRVAEKHISVYNEIVREEEG
jgi:glycosyltransferase involved in cell wall biosynthesis